MEDFKLEGGVSSLIFFYKEKGKEVRMDELKLYSISDEYIEWLRKDYPNVYSNKIDAEPIQESI